MKEKIVGALKSLWDDSVSNHVGNISSAINSLGVNEFVKSDIAKEFFATVTKSVSTMKADDYDKALDAVYNKTHIGGNNHRLFDNSHDLLSAWDKVKDALPNDSRAEEIMGLFSAFWKDFTTVKGMPFKNFEKSEFDAWVAEITAAVPGLKREYFTDLLQTNAGEMLSTVVGVGSAIFFLNKADKEKLSEILGAMGASSIISANPIMGISAVCLLMYAMFVQKMKLDKTVALKSASTVVLSSAIFAVLGVGFVVELIVVIIATNAFRKYVLNNEDLAKLVQHYYTHLVSQDWLTRIKTSWKAG